MNIKYTLLFSLTCIIDVNCMDFDGMLHTHKMRPTYPPIYPTRIEDYPEATTIEIFNPTLTEQIEAIHKKIKNIEKELQSPNSKNWNKIKKQESLRKIKIKTLKIKMIGKKDQLEQTNEFKNYQQMIKRYGLEDYHPVYSDFFESNPLFTKSINSLKKNQFYKDINVLNKKKILLSTEPNLFLSLQRSKKNISDHIQNINDDIAEHKQYLHSWCGHDCSPLRKKAINTYIKMEQKKINYLSTLNKLVDLEKTNNYFKVLDDCKVTNSCDTSLELERAVFLLQDTSIFIYCKKLNKEVDLLDMKFTEQIFRDQLPQHPSHFIYADDFGRYNLIPPLQEPNPCPDDLPFY